MEENELKNLNSISNFPKNNFSGWWIVFVVFLLSGGIKIALSLKDKNATINRGFVDSTKTDSAKMVAQPNQAVQPTQDVQTAQSQLPDTTSTPTETVNPYDTVSMKYNLMGNDIPGERFTAVNEIETFSVLKRTVNEDRIECTVDLLFTNEMTAQILMTYFKNNNAWSLLGVKEIYITFLQPVPLDNWTQVCPIPNCNWTIKDDSKLSWKINENGPEYQSGSDVPHLTLPKSDCFFLKSREEGPLNIRFIYTPIPQ